jgi:hypothetical protein
VTRRRDERGAVAVFVALVLTVLLGCGALAVDLGDLWQSRRHLVTATDAAALAAAQSAALGETACGAVDDQFVAANYDDATVTGCTVEGAGTPQGLVTVDASAPVDVRFASVLGFDDQEVHAGTAAAWFIPAGAYSLRPFGLCKDHPAVASWLSSPDGQSSPTVVRYSKDSPDACGDAPGNWGILDYDGGSNSTGEIQEWTRYGYDGLVSVGEDVPGNTGGFSPSLDSVLDEAIQGGRFALPIFDSVQGTGSNARFHVYGFVGVELVSYQTSGPEENRYITLRFVEMLVAGQCCAAGPNSGTFAVRICDVDHHSGEANC